MVRAFYALILLVALVQALGLGHDAYVVANALSGSRRRLAQDEQSSILTADDQTEFQLASSTFGDLSNYASQPNWSVANLTATIELDTEASYANNFMVNQPGSWMPGMTRFNVTANLTRTTMFAGNAAPPTISARLHTETCDSGKLMTSLLADSSSGNITSSYAAALGLNMSSIDSNVENSTVYDFLVDYDEVKAVVLYGNNQIMACKNIKPPFPNFPSDWSATIEITDTQRGSTFVMRETYSQTLNKVRLELHSFGTDTILVNDPSNSQVTAITPSNGSCKSFNGGPMTNWITQEDNSTLLSTAELLHFTQDNNIQYVPGIANVRGIPCEIWQTSADISFRNFSASFDVEFYFPINQWLVAREDYHRMLKRVYMNGTRNDEPFETYFEYVNFRPRTAYSAIFDTCAISPYGQNCNCTDQLRKAAFSNLTAALTDGDDLSVSSAASAACQYGQGVPHGFISAQSGPYVGLTIIGMVGGSLITGLAMYLYYRKRVGVRISDHLGHSKFVDAPGT